MRESCYGRSIDDGVEILKLLSNNSLVSQDLTDKIKIEDIKIGERFRSEIGDISELVESIKNNGLLCPITVTKDGLLVAEQEEEKNRFDIANNRLKILAAQLRDQSNFNDISSDEKEVY